MRTLIYIVVFVIAGVALSGKAYPGKQESIKGKPAEEIKLVEQGRFGMGLPCLFKVTDEVNFVNTDRVGTVTQVDKRYGQSPLYLVEWRDGGSYWVDEKNLAYKDWQLKIDGAKQENKVTYSNTTFIKSTKLGLYKTGPLDPVVVVDKDMKEIFVIKDNGDFILRGKKIANDKEVAEKFKNIWGKQEELPCPR